jgi:hypothetical protein
MQYALMLQVGHIFNMECPFGGKGSSGMGSYRGRFSFEGNGHISNANRNANCNAVL